MNQPKKIQWDMCAIRDYATTLIPWYQGFIGTDLPQEALDRFSAYFSELRTDLILIAECPYTDKVFRDSYYHFHAAKYRDISRDCMRVYLFEPGNDFSMPFVDNDPEALQRSFLGYFVLRPLATHPFGRSMISPKAFSRRDFVSCLSTSTCSFFGHKLKVSAYPHESQDAETHTCAETAIWTIFEYYGNLYSEHRPVLPTDITRTLQAGAPRRLLPSKGLSVIEIARALQNLGHDTQTFSREAGGMNDKDFFRYLQYLIESGIPVILGLELFNTVKNTKDGHAVVVMGHTTKRTRPSAALPTPTESRGNIRLYDTADIPCDLVSIDDNRPPYTMLSPTSPGTVYGTAYQAKSKINHFIVPLHRHMYMDVIGASKLIRNILWNTNIGIPKFTQNTDILYRILLTGSRSFKNWLLQDSAFTPKLKEIVIGTAMPRFIWVCELSRPKAYATGKANGFMLIDATGPVSEESLLLNLFAGKITLFDEDGSFEYQSCGTFTFSQYKNNLKGEWSNWGLQ